MATGFHTAKEKEERPAPRDNAAELAAMLAESPADTVVAANQALFNRSFRRAIGGSLNAGIELTSITDSIDRQALRHFSAYEGGSAVGVDGAQEHVRQRYDDWLNALATDLGFRMSPEQLSAVIFRGGDEELNRLLQSEDGFRQAIIQAYRRLGRLSEALIAGSWVMPNVQAELQAWPEDEAERRRLFTQVFDQRIRPEVLRQLEAQQTRVTQLPAQPEINEAEYNNRADAVLGAFVPQAAAARDARNAQRLIERATQRLAYEAFTPVLPSEDQRRQRMMEVDDLTARFNRGGVWVMPTLRVAATAAPRPAPSQQGAAGQARGGGAQEEARQTAQGQPAEGAPEARVQATPRRSLWTKVRSIPALLKDNMLTRNFSPTALKGYFLVNNQLTRAFTWPTRAFYGALWRNRRRVAAVGGGAIAGGLLGPLGAVGGAIAGNEAYRRRKTQ